MTSASIGVKLLSVALNALSGLAISLLIKGITWAIDELIVTTEEAKETLNESVSEFESLTDEVKSLETELKTCTERLADLQKLANNGTISIADEEQLRLLKEENEELERKLALKQAEQIDSQKEVLKNAKQLSDKEVKSKYILQDIDGGIYYEKVNPAEELIAAIDKYNEFKENPNGYGFIDEQYVESASKRVQEMYDIISPTIDAYNKLIDAGYILTGEDKKRYEQLKQVQDEYLLYNYSLNGTKEAFQGLNVAQQKNIVLNRLLNQGLSDIQANSVLSNINEDDLDDLWGSDFSFTPPDMKDTSTAEEYGKAYAEAWLASIGETIQDEDNKIDDSRTKMISSINDMSEGFEELDKIYSSIKDDDPFDFKLLDDKAFKETFSTLDGYADFIEQITSNSDDIEACQSAFNNLVSEWITSTNVLDNVTKENEKLTAAMLKQMGVTNADEIAHYALEKAKAKEYVQSKDNINVTEDNINSLINEANTAGITTNAYLELVAKEILFNDNDINTASKCEQILAIAKTAGIASASLSALNSEIANVAGKKIGSGARTEYAQSKGVEVISEKNRKDGKKNGNLYVVGGKEFDDFTEAMQYAEAYNTMQNISSAFSQYTVPTYTGGSKSNSSSSSKDTKETFDWIETKISRLQRSITNFGKTVSATWKSWTDRNYALKSQISAVTSEINLQQQAANKYLSLANGVGLSSSYKELVRNGSLNISTIKDENTINAIKQYQEYYEAYLSCLDAKQDAENELANLVREDFDMIAKQFDSEISLVEANISTLEAYIDQTEMKGNLVSKNYYSAMYAEEQKNLSLLQQKYDQLSNKLSNGTVKQGSEEFNEMAKEIKEVSKAIIESNTAIEEYQKTMRELDWEVFDLIEEKIGNVTEESEFLIDLLSNSKLFNDDGSITSQGQVTLGLHVANMKVYESQIKDYADEIARLDEEFANDSLDQNYLERREELVELQRDSILAMQDEKQSIKDLMSEGYDSLLSYMDEVINKRKELFSQTSDARSFQKTVQEQTDEITRLQNILNSYNGDLSEEAKAAVQKYEIELKDAESNLEDTLYDKYISDQEQMLDALADDTEQWVNERLDNINGLIEDVITSTDANADTIKTTLETEVKGVGGTLTTEMQNLWSGADGVKGVVGGVNNTLLEIKNLVQSMVKASDTEASKNPSGATTNATPATKPATTPQSTPATTQQSSTKAITVGGMINASGALIYDYAGDTSGERQYYRNSPYYRVLSEKNGYLKVRHQSLSSGTTGWFKKSDVKAYKTGGLVDYTGLAWVDGQKGKPEAFLNANDTELFAKLKDSLEIVSKTNMFDAIQNYAKMPNFVGGTSNRNITNHNTFEFNMPNVKDADDFITDLQHSKRFENIVLEITDGKGDLSKYKW